MVPMAFVNVGVNAWRTAGKLVCKIKYEEQVLRMFLWPFLVQKGLVSLVKVKGGSRRVLYGSRNGEGLHRGTLVVTGSGNYGHRIFLGALVTKSVPALLTSCFTVSAGAKLRGALGWAFDMV